MPSIPFKCYHCEDTIEKLEVRKKTADVAPIWKFRCPKCGMSVGTIDNRNDMFGGDGDVRVLEADEY